MVYEPFSMWCRHNNHISNSFFVINFVTYKANWLIVKYWIAELLNEEFQSFLLHQTAPEDPCSVWILFGYHALSRGRRCFYNDDGIQVTRKEMYVHLIEHYAVSHARNLVWSRILHTLYHSTSICEYLQMTIFDKWGIWWIQSICDNISWMKMQMIGLWYYYMHHVSY